MTTADLIDLIDGALRLFDGGRNWRQRVTWDGEGACLGGGLAAQVVDLDAWYRMGLGGIAYVWPLVPADLRAAVVTAITDQCHRCRGAWATGAIEPYGIAQPTTEREIVAHHNDNHVQGYPEIAALLGAVKGALVGKAEDVGVLV